MLCALPCATRRSSALENEASFSQLPFTIYLYTVRWKNGTLLAICNPGICYNIVITEQYAVKSEKLKVESKAFSVLRCKFSVQWSKCLIVRDLQDLHDLHDLQDQYLCPELCALSFSSSPLLSVP